MSEATYTLHVSTTTIHGGAPTVEAMITKDIPAGVCGPFTGSERLDDVRGMTPFALAAHALEELRMSREFVAGEPTVHIGYDGLRLTFPLHRI